MPRRPPISTLFPYTTLSDLAEDVRADPRRRHRIEELSKTLDPIAHAAVELAEDEGTRAAVQDPPRRHPVGRPIDQAPDGAPRAQGSGDQLLVQAVLERDDGAVGGEPR